MKTETSPILPDIRPLEGSGYDQKGMERGPVRSRPGQGEEFSARGKEADRAVPVIRRAEVRDRCFQAGRFEGASVPDTDLRLRPYSDRRSPWEKLLEGQDEHVFIAPGGRLFEVGQGYGVGQSVRADRGPPQHSEMGPATEALAQVMGERADVCPGRTRRLELQLGRAVTPEDEARDR